MTGSLLMNLLAPWVDMLSIDTNLLLYTYCVESPEHDKALSFLEEWNDSEEVALCEFVLLELYQLLRNPAVLRNPLSPAGAVEVIQQYRGHPRWRVLGFPPDSKTFHQALWQHAGIPMISRRALFDCRIALTLRAFQVDEFATANTKDFQHFGFKTVWNPLKS